MEQPSAGEPAGPAPVATDARSPRNANYEIDARLDEAAKTIHGKETIRWRNITDLPANELQFHLYWNAWRDIESTWLRERRIAGLFTPPQADAWSTMDVTSLRLRETSGQTRDLTKDMRFIAPDDGNAKDRTVMSVSLGRSVGPNESIEVEVEWTAKIPRPFARTGWIGDYYFIAQWFPKLGVLESEGWNTHQFHVATEFFSDFGVYDVRLTLPRRFVVGASGRQTTRTDNADGTTTHRYQEDDIHDFAWTASPDFLDLTQRFEHPTLPAVDIRLLLAPGASRTGRPLLHDHRATLKRYGEWFGAYPYGHITVVDPAFQSESDGMEYPTLVTGRSRWLARRTTQIPESTTAHEVGHQWWYAMVATNEFEHAWMDEGIQHLRDRTRAGRGDEFQPRRVEILRGVHSVVVSRHPGDAHRQRSTRGVSLQRRGRRTVDADVPVLAGDGSHHQLQQDGALDAHARAEGGMARDATHHEHLLRALEVQASQAIGLLRHRARGHGSMALLVLRRGVPQLQHVRLRRTGVPKRTVDEKTYTHVCGRPALRRGDVPGGRGDDVREREQIKETWNGQERRAIYVYERPARGTTVQVDPDHVLLLDVAYTNNSRTLKPSSGKASLKWSLRWMVWLQDLMLTYGFFV